jgi:hypothetical protein
MIFERFGIPALSDDYKSVDCRMLATERRDVYLCPNPHWSSDYEPFGIKIVQWSQEEAMRTWLGTAIALLAGKEYPWCLQ